MAEFDITESGALRLLEYGVKPLGMEGSLESKREATLQSAVQELLSERNFLAKDASICAPGLHVFSKFIKLPPVDTSKVTQIIQYEAQQNVPFPLEDVVWDYQISGTTASGELEVLLVAIKTEVVESLFRVSEGASFRVQLVDASPAALCNAFRFNYGDLDGCTMLLDIGAKTSNVLLFEKGKFYSRSINIGANTITQDFGTESKLRFNEAEAIKIEQGFVSLGGAYAEPESKHQAAISKIARQVMTRLHIQVNQTIQFYRGQQGGSAPVRLFLCGGASVMPYTVEFFADKLSVEVEYFNPLRNLEIAPEVDLEHLATVAHAMGETVGTALHNLAECPVELNLMPKSSLQRQQLNRKKPYFIAAAASLILVLGALGWFFNSSASQKQQVLASIQEEIRPLEVNDRQVKSGLRTRDTHVKSAEQLMTYLEDQVYWVKIFSELRDSLRSTEKQYSTGGVSAGIWIEELSVGHQPGDVASLVVAEESASVKDAQKRQEEQAALYRKRMAEAYGSDIFERQVASQTPADTTTESEAVPEDPEDLVATINMVCRAVNLNRLKSDPSANTALVYGLVNQLKQNALFDPAAVRLSREMPQASDEDVTFNFELSVKLARPIQL